MLCSMLNIELEFGGGLVAENFHALVTAVAGVMRNMYENKNVFFGLVGVIQFTPKIRGKKKKS